MDLLGWQQFDFVTLRLQHSTPMVGAAAGLHRDQRGLAIYKEIRYTIALAFYTHQLARLKVDDVQLKNVFYDVRKSSNCTWKWFISVWFLRVALQNALQVNSCLLIVAKTFGICALKQARERSVPEFR